MSDNIRIARDLLRQALNLKIVDDDPHKRALIEGALALLGSERSAVMKGGATAYVYDNPVSYVESMDAAEKSDLVRKAEELGWELVPESVAMTRLGQSEVQTGWVWASAVHHLRVNSADCVEVRPDDFDDYGVSQGWFRRRSQRVEHGDRGLGWYMDERDQYGVTTIEVSDSSAAEAPHAWLRLESPLTEHLGRTSGGYCSAHLDAIRVRRLIEALQEWQRYHGVAS